MNHPLSTLLLSLACLTLVGAAEWNFDSGQADAGAAVQARMRAERSFRIFFWSLCLRAPPTAGPYLYARARVLFSATI